MSRVVGGRYELGELIAIDSDGELWQATDSIVFKPLAIRLVSPATVDRQATRQLAVVNHPCIVRIYDYGTDFVAMELVAGQPLSPSVPADAVLRALAQLAEGLQLVHQAGVAHGDIKLADLIVRPDGTVVLTGFGFTGRQATAAVDLERLGTIAAQCLAGTPGAEHWAEPGRFASATQFAEAIRAVAPQLDQEIAAETEARSGPVAAGPMSPPAPVSQGTPPAPRQSASPPPAPVQSAPPVPAPVYPSQPAPPQAARSAPAHAASWESPYAQVTPRGSGGAKRFGQPPVATGNFKMTVGYPKRLAKGRASAFIVQIHLPEGNEAAVQRLLEAFGDTASGRVSSGRQLPLGRDVSIALSSPDVAFSAAKQWQVSPSGIDAAFFGRPGEDARPGGHAGILTITETGSHRELASMPFTVTIADFALGKMSRPTLRGVVTGVLIVASVGILGYSFMNQVQEVMGVVTGVVGAAISAVVTVRTTALYSRKTAGATTTVPMS